MYYFVLEACLDCNGLNYKYIMRLDLNNRGGIEINDDDDHIEKKNTAISLQIVYNSK